MQEALLPEMTVQARKDEALRAAILMRKAQKAFYAAALGTPRKRALLRESLGLEKRFDEMVAHLPAEDDAR